MSKRAREAAHAASAAQRAAVASAASTAARSAVEHAAAAPAVDGAVPPAAVASRPAKQPRLHEHATHASEDGAVGCTVSGRGQRDAPVAYVGMERFDRQGKVSCANTLTPAHRARHDA
ncbi:hypothetical protein EON66_08580 [archaeon]|nr:MAG: hypothetical protein EON66_08580 [archaeon]